MPLAEHRPNTFASGPSEGDTLEVHDIHLPAVNLAIFGIHDYRHPSVTFSGLNPMTLGSLKHISTTVRLEVGSVVDHVHILSRCH